MNEMTDLKTRLRPLYTQVFERSPTARILYLLAKPKTNRDTDFVRDGYMGSWGAYQERLDRSSTLDEWLCIRGFDDAPSTHVREGKVIHIITERLEDWTDKLSFLRRDAIDPSAFDRAIAPADEVGREVRQIRHVLPDGRNFR